MRKWKKIMTPATATSDRAKFTSENSTFSTGKTAFSTRTFLMRGAASMMELMAPLVASLMSVKAARCPG